jgi:tRNA (guanosine-2'-O-)-methyltransferase
MLTVKGVQSYSLFFMTRNKELIHYLSAFVTQRRLKTIDRVLGTRTRYITVLLEDIYQPHNASAVLRTCDCFGIQDVHIVENRNVYRVNPDVALGSAQWLSLRKYNRSGNNTPDALAFLRKKGYRLVVTIPHARGVPLHQFDLSKGKIALLFGTELTGLSPEAVAQADEYLYIPMTGFTESLNISVSAAVILHHLTLELRNANISWKLSALEKEKLKLEWLKNSIKKAAGIMREYHRRQESKK